MGSSPLSSRPKSPSSSRPRRPGLLERDRHLRDAEDVAHSRTAAKLGGYLGRLWLAPRRGSAGARLVTLVELLDHVDGIRIVRALSAIALSPLPDPQVA